MAKIGEGVPYAAEILKAGPGGMVDVQNAALAALSADLDDLVNRYYSVDWLLVAAAMEATVGALKSHLEPVALRLEELLVKKAVCVSATVKMSAGGNSPGSVKGGGSNG